MVYKIISNLKWDLKLLHDKSDSIDFIKELVKTSIKLGVVR